MISILKALGWLLHSVISRSARLSTAYFRLLAPILKRLPDDRNKIRIFNSISSVEWPWKRIELDPQTVSMEGVSFRLVPHFGEFDFYALGFREMKYENCVFAYLRRSGKKYDAVVEIGANVGIYTLFFCKFYEGCTVYSFEPSQKAYDRLLGNLAANGDAAARVRTFNVAVGEKTSVETFYEPARHLTNGSFSRPFAERFTKDIIERKVVVLGAAHLDDVFERHRRVLLKIDAECSESSILKGMAGLIDAKRPDILVECIEEQEEALNRSGLLEKYVLFQITDEGAVRRERFVAGEFRDYFLEPKA